MSSPPEKQILQPGLFDIEEKEVLPGVYITDYRIAATAEAIPYESPLLAVLQGDNFAEIDEDLAAATQPRERQLAAGVYMTDFRDTPGGIRFPPKTSFGAPVYPSSTSFEHPELADARIQELHNAIQHLERSNTEMEEMKATDPDPIWQESIEENLGVITRKKAEIQKILTEHTRNTCQSS